MYILCQLHAEIGHALIMAMYSGYSKNSRHVVLDKLELVNLARNVVYTRHSTFFGLCTGYAVKNESRGVCSRDPKLIELSVKACLHIVAQKLLIRLCNASF